MPQKKTGQRRKKEKQKDLQKKIQCGRSRDDVKNSPTNQEMICDQCDRRQKNRVACYFCNAVQKLVQCAECGKFKCMGTTGECMVKHPGRNVTGLAFLGAICDFCEAGICHARKCLQAHACDCLLRNSNDVVICVECDRSVWEHGGRSFRCSTCYHWLCEDDQFEHQASCQVLESENYKCLSCNRLGVYSCLRCKVCYCAEHVKGFAKIGKGDPLPCKSCGQVLHETKSLSISVRTHEYGRQQMVESSESEYSED